MDSIDDDFGDLYADVEVQATSAVDFPVAQNQDGNNVCDKHGVDASSPVKNSISNSEKPDLCFDDSESDDDLHIVLNDNGPSNANHHGRGIDAVTTGRSKTAVSDCTELKSGNVAKSENSPQLKYIRDSVSPLPCDIQVKRCSGSTSSWGRSDWHTHGYKHEKWGRAQFGSCSSLSWYRTILDFNIDAFHDTPWSQPGVDITDFFNFGFDAGSWMQYCKLIEQVRLEPLMQDRAQVSGFQKFNMEKGSAIAVHGGTSERLPSMDVAYPHFRDSDAVIEISVQDSLLDSSSSHEAELGHTEREKSEHGAVAVKLKSEVVCGEISKDLKDTVENVNTPSFQRSLQPEAEASQMLVENSNYEDANISDLGGHCLQKTETCTVKEITEARGGGSKEDGLVCRDSCGSDICLVERQSSVSSQNRLNLSSSFSGTDSCGRSEDNIESDYLRSSSPQRTQSLDSETELNGLSGSETSAGYDSKTKLVVGKAQPVQRSPVQEKQAYGDRRLRRSPGRISHESNYESSLKVRARAHRKSYARARSPVQGTRRRYDDGRNRTGVEKIYSKRCKDVYPVSDVKFLDDKNRCPVKSRKHESVFPDVCNLPRGYSRGRSHESDYESSLKVQARAHRKSYARVRSPVQETRRRYHDGRKSTRVEKICSKRHKDVYPVSDMKALDDKDSCPVKSRKHESVFPVVGHLPRGYSKYWKRRHSNNYHAGRNRFSHHQTDSNKYSWLEADWNSREKLNQDIRRNTYEYRFRKREIFTGGHSDGESKGDHVHARHSECEFHYSDRDWRRLDSKCPSFYKHRASLAGRENAIFQSSKRIDGGGCPYEDYPLQDREDHDFVSFSECEMDLQVRRHRGWLAESERETDVSNWMDRHVDAALFLDDSWHNEDDYNRLSLVANRGSWRCDKSQQSKIYDLELSKGFNKDKLKCSKNNKNCDPFGYDVKDSFFDDNQADSYLRRHGQRKLQRLEGDLTLGHQYFGDAAEDEPVLHERSFELETADVDNGFSCGKLLSNTQRSRRVRKGRPRRHNNSSRCQQKATSLNCRDGNDIVEKVKCHGRQHYIRTLSNHKNRKLEMKFLKRSSRTAFSGHQGTKRTKNSFSSIKGNGNGEREQVKLLVTQQNDELDIEEGHVLVADEVNTPETVVVPCGVKLPQSGSSSKAKDEYDSDWISKSLAKMEKRRERFQHPPVAAMRQTDDAQKPEVAVVVDDVIAKGKQDRPARKRRWGELNVPRSKFFSHKFLNVNI